MKLYKYRQMNDFTFDLIYNNNHYFSKPANLNDPFEFKFDLILSTDKEAIISKLANRFLSCEKDELDKMAFAYRIQGTKESNEVADLMYSNPTKCAEKIYHKAYVEYPEIFREGKRKTLLNAIENTYTISCFTEIKDSTLMFSHYADYHKGVCLEFEFNEDIIKDSWLFKVTYSKNYPVWEDMFAEEKVQEVIRNTLLTKAIDWQYENEWRLLDKSDGVKNLDKICKLTGIIMGSKISIENESKIRTYCSSRNLEANLYQKILTGEDSNSTNNSEEMDSILYGFKKIKLMKAETTNKYGLNLINCG